MSIKWLTSPASPLTSQVTQSKTQPILCQGPLLLTNIRLSSLRLNLGISTISSPSPAAISPLAGDFRGSGVALAKDPSRFEGDGEEALLLLYVGANLAGKVEGGGSGAGRRKVVPVLALLLLDGAVVGSRREGFDNCFLILERDWDDLTLANHQLDKPYCQKAYQESHLVPSFLFLESALFLP